RTQRCDHRTRHARDQIADETHRDDHGTWRNHRHSDRVHELSLVQPLVVVHHAPIEEWHDGQSAAEHERTSLREKGAELAEKRPIETGRYRAGRRPLRAECDESWRGTLAGPMLGGRAYKPNQQSPAQEQPDAFRFTPNREDGGDNVDGPEELIFAD